MYLLLLLLLLWGYATPPAQTSPFYLPSIICLTCRCRYPFLFSPGWGGQCGLRVLLRDSTQWARAVARTHNLMIMSPMLYPVSHGAPRGVLRHVSGKVCKGMCGPDRVLFQPLRFTNRPFLFQNWFGYTHTKMLNFLRFFLWFICRLSKSTYGSYASQFTC